MADDSIETTDKKGIRMITIKLCLVFLLLNSFPDLSNARHIAQEIIRVTQHSPKPRARRDLDLNLYSPASSILTGSDFPEHMEFTLHLKDGDKKLDLWKHQSPHEITMKKDKGVVKFEGSKAQFAAYQDTKTHSVMIVDCSHPVDICTLSGSFYRSAEKFNLKPLNNSLVSYNVTRAKSDYSITKHGKIKPNTKGEQFSGQGEQLLHEEIVKHIKRDGHKIRKRSTISTDCYILEVDIITDTTVTDYYLARECNNPLAAESELLKHFLALFTEVDLRYKCLGELGHPICFRVFLSSIRPGLSTSGFTDIDSNSNGFKDGLAILANCQTLADKSPHVDFTICFTKFDFEYDGSSLVKGLNYPGVICSLTFPLFRQGIIEDTGDDENLDIASQILAATTVTADTKTRPEPECNSTLLFIGADVNDPPVDPSTIQNPWRFSNCSIEELKAFLDASGSCLQSGTIDEDDFEAWSLKQPFPGKIFDLDYQCQLTYGLSSFAVVGPGETSIFDVHDICYRGVYCDVNGTNTHRSRVYNGSPCGCKEICEKNLCVREFNIPLGGDCLGCCECADNNSICDCETKTCVCDEGFYDDNLGMPNGTCILLKANNESCPFDEACEDEFAVCDNDTHICVCIQGYTLRDGVCVRVCSNGTLPNITNGMYMTQDIIEGSIANLKCDEGYAATSIDTCSVCLPDGNFSSTTVHCQRDCGCPPMTPNGQFVLNMISNTTEGSTATLICGDGYSTNMTVTITCENTPQGWSSASQNCTINDCGSHLPTVADGMFVANEGTTVGKPASLVCDHGYTPMSTDTCIVCLTNGSWSAPMTGCIRDCGCPPVASNGDYVLDNGNTTKGSTATLNCCEGYSVNGTIKITCENTPQGWSDSSENCTINDCGSTLPTVSDGMFVANEGTTVGKPASLVCDHGYTPMSTDTCIVCLTNGSWSAPMTGCIRDCGCPPVASNGDYVLDNGNTTKGSTATLNCCEGYSVNGTIKITCENTPQGWSYASENCTINDCGSTLPTVSDGMFVANEGTTVGKPASLVCDHGYTPMSTDTCIVCLTNGSWSAPMTGCIRDCGCPPVAFNGDYVLDNGNTTKSSTATLNCCEGYSVNGTIKITCEDTPQGWSDSSENCTINDCGSMLPTVSDGMFVANEGTTVGKPASLVCDHGYTPMSTDTCIVCLTNGSWSAPMTGCIRDCGCPPMAPNGDYVLDDGNTTKSSTATLNCCEGYSVNGTVKITCENTPQGWSDPSKNCTIKDCGSYLPTVADGMFVANEGTTVGKPASLVCDHGYTPMSTDTCIVCLTNGSWSAPMTGCIRDCGCPPESRNGDYVLDNGNTTKSSTATLNCCEGYSVNGTIKITCEDTSQGWSDSSENCTIKDCGSYLPTVSDGMFVANEGTTVGKPASLVCDHGYTSMSTDTCIVCLTNGSWSAPMTGCIRDCGCPPETHNGDYVLVNGNTTKGSTAILNCCEGYMTNSKITITCKDTQQGWSSPAENCTIKDCGTSLPVVTDGSFVTTGDGGTTVGSLGTLVCDSGYVPMSEDTCIVCQPNGTWSHPSTGCVRNCGCPPEAVFGSYTLTDPNNTTLGSTAEYNCCPGYELQSVVTITCEDTSEGWSSPSENCTLKDCETTPTTANGSFVASAGSVVGSIATLECDYGFTSTSSDTCIVCELSGKWSTPMSECIRDCGCPPEVKNGEFLLEEDENTTLGSTVELECCPGSSILSPPVIITCESTGWSTPSGNCSINDCGSPPSVSNGGFVALGVTTVGGLATLICDSGYTTSDLVPIIVCTNKGNWSISNASCTRDCGCPPEATNGQYVLDISNSTTLGAIATLSCCDGFSTSTTVKITCEGDSQGWSTPGQTCTGNVCPSTALPVVPFGAFKPQANTVGSLAVLNCDDGFAPNSEDVCVACLLNGTWDSSSTACITDCGIPPNTATHSFNVTSGTLLGATAEIICCEGLLPVETNITCTASGWDDLTKAVCRGCPHGWIRFLDACYLLGNSTITNQAANATCNGFDSHIYDSNLVKIDSVAEREFLRQAMKDVHPQPSGNDVGFWLGLFQTGPTRNEVEWLPSEEPLDAGVADWNPGSSEPNSDTQRCATAFRTFNYRWTDIECANIFNSVADGRTAYLLCEIDL